MPREHELYLHDILGAIRDIRLYTLNISFETFSQDPMRVDAVIRKLEVIGEAVKNLPLPTLQREPSVNWKEIMRARDLIAHGYFRISPKIIWETVQTDLAPLEEAVKRLLENH